jgi:hypothetical protein
VETKSGKSFYIEAKLSPAQCGQFVLQPDLESATFLYSPQNINRMNQYTQHMIDYMNNDFHTFREAGTPGKELQMKNGADIFAGWIMEVYHNKGVEFFITNEFTILPIESFSKYFEISAKYRIKRSGSSNLGKNRISSVMDYIREHNYVITNFHVEGDKLFVTSTQDLHDTRFILKGIEYMFALRNNEFELRKLSNTYHANVIFSIKQRPVDGLNNEDFTRYLE